MNDNELLAAASRAARDESKFSVTWLREKFSIGYGRAVGIKFQLQKRGVIKENGEVIPEQKPDCAESGIELRKEKTIAVIEIIGKEFEKFQEIADTVEKDAVNMTNTARAIGIHLQTFCEHEQISFEFWQKHCEGKLPFKFDAAKTFVAVARAMPKPAKSLTEASKFIQPILAANGNLLIPERAESQSSASVSLMERFWNELDLIRQPFKKLLSERPMENWTKTQIETFLESTGWIAAERDRAIILQDKLLRK